MRSSPGRVAWVAAGSVFAIVALAWGTFTAIGLTAYAETDTHVEIDATTAAAITTLELHSDAGSARIVGSATDRIVVDAEITYGLKKPQNDTHVEGDTLVVRSSCSAWANTWCDVSYTIAVPAGVSVVARAGGGGLRIEGVDGAIDASSSGGGVHVIGARGPLRIDSSGGGVRADDVRSAVVDVDSSGGGVRLSFVTPPRTVRASSSGGGVTIEVPSPYAFAIDAESSGGGVDVSGVAHDPDSDRTITADSSGGGVTIRYRTD